MKKLLRVEGLEKSRAQQKLYPASNPGHDAIVKLLQVIKIFCNKKKKDREL